MNTLDIISIHNTLSRKYQQTQTLTQNPVLAEQAQQAQQWNDIYKDMQSYQMTSKNVVEDIENKIKTLKNDQQVVDNNFYFYLLRSLPILEKYCALKKSQNKIQFVRTNSEPMTESTEALNTLIQEYMVVLENYFPDEYIENQIDRKRQLGQSTQKSSKIRCHECNLDQDVFSICDNHFVCEKCGLVSATMQPNISYKDIDRINISSKYTYDRRTHFRDCINQFQGKQNASIDQKVYNDIIEQLLLHGLIPENHKELSKAEAFKNITKEHVMLFLKETGYSKHYEDVVLIYYQLTDKQPPDISHLENDLLRDFDVLTDLYDKKYKNSERKNFINTQYVLFQLLRRHKFPCRKEDFNILKTIDRKYYHDTICGDLFTTLGWNFQALF